MAENIRNETGQIKRKATGRATVTPVSKISWSHELGHDWFTSILVLVNLHDILMLHCINKASLFSTYGNERLSALLL